MESPGSHRLRSGRVSDPGRLYLLTFHDRALRREEDVKAVARYIIANPFGLAWCGGLVIIHIGIVCGCESAGEGFALISRHKAAPTKSRVRRSMWERPRHY